MILSKLSAKAEAQHGLMVARRQVAGTFGSCYVSNLMQGTSCVDGYSRISQCIQHTGTVSSWE